MRIRQWGNSAALRIPAPALAAANLAIDAEVRLTVEGGRLIIEPAGRYDLDEMLAAITPENMHEEIDFGPPVGKEAL